MSTTLKIPAVDLPETEEEMAAILAEDPLSPEDVKIKSEHVLKILELSLVAGVNCRVDPRDLPLAQQAVRDLTREIAKLQVCLAIMVDQLAQRAQEGAGDSHPDPPSMSPEELEEMRRDRETNQDRPEDFDANGNPR